MASNLQMVFISYAHEDKEAAIKLYSDLKNAGANPWIDAENLLPGRNWRNEISKAIRSSRYFIAVLSTNSVGRKGYVQKEVADALDILEEFPESEIFIIPIRLDDCRPSHEKLGELHWANMFPNWENGIAKIMSAIKSNDPPFKISPTEKLSPGGFYLSPQTKNVIIEAQNPKNITTVTAHTFHGYQDYSPDITTYGYSSPDYEWSAHSYSISPPVRGRIYNKKLYRASSSWEITYDKTDLEAIIEERILADIFDELEKDPKISEYEASVLANAIANRWSKSGLNIKLWKSDDSY